MKRKGIIVLILMLVGFVKLEAGLISQMLALPRPAPMRVAFLLKTDFGHLPVPDINTRSVSDIGEASNLVNQQV